MKLFHGTSNKLGIKNILLPAIATGNNRENRRCNLDVVFLTKSKRSAEMYARKACLKYGEYPLILEIISTDNSHEIHNNEVICLSAIVNNNFEKGEIYG